MRRGTRSRVKRKRSYTAKRGGTRSAITKRQRGFVRTSGFYRGNGVVASKELKFHDIAITDAVVAAAGAIQNSGSVNLIAQGTTESTRIGRKCTIKSIAWRFDIELPTFATAGAGGNDTIRVILYLDKQANGATAAGDDIVEDSTNWQTFNNLANTGRFRTLMDRTYDMNRNSGAGDGTSNDWSGAVHHDTFFKQCNIPLEFSSTTGAITEIRSNNIGVLLLSKSGLAGFNSLMRLRFVG